VPFVGHSAKKALPRVALGKVRLSVMSWFTFDHYAVAPDAVDRDDREFNNKTERVKQELWVSLSIM
jgi:hypothetical protein